MSKDVEVIRASYRPERDQLMARGDQLLSSAKAAPALPRSIRFTYKADIDARQTDVCFVPIADIAPLTQSPRRRGRVLPAEL
jgi:hypothetical protein